MFTRTKNALCGVALCALLVGTMAFPYVGQLRQANADELSDAQATLDAASAELNSITVEYEQLQTELSSLNAQITATTEKVQAAQQAMLEGQENLGETVLSSYKSDSSLSLLGVILNSEDLSTIIKNLSYYTAIQEDQAEQVATQKQLRDEFSSALSELDTQRDAQQEVVTQAESKKAEAEKVVSEASAKVANIQEAQAQLAAMQAQAAALQEQQAAESSEVQESSNWNTNTDRNPTVADSSSSSDSSSDSSSGSSSSSGAESSSSSSSSSSSDASSGWHSGLASAYGGSSDPSTPNPGTTATGATCNDSSMGVAVPMAWSNYRSYFGRAVEIRYGGKTVVATVNDCGGLGGGSRSLDLQPGVFKAFGYSTCQAWGVRTVSYRFL